MFTKAWCGTLLLLSLSGNMIGDVPAEPGKDDIQDAKLRQLNIDLTEKLGKSLVNVNYYFTLDKNYKVPEYSVKYLCPNCNNYHHQSIDSLIEDERPMRVPGYMVSEDEIISSDINVIPEWFKTIEVEFNGKKATAEIIAYYPGHQSVRLKLSQPLPGIRPLQFKNDLSGKRFIFYRAEEKAVGFTITRPFSFSAIQHLQGTGEDWVSTIPNSLIVNADGQTETLYMTKMQRLSDGKPLLPDKWPSETVAQRNAAINQLNEFIRTNCYPVTIRLAQSSSNKNKMMGGYGEEEVNEINTLGLKLQSGELLVIANMNARQTARLDSVEIKVGENKVKGKFIGSLKYFGGIIIKPENDIPDKGIELYPSSPVKLFQEFAWTAIMKNADGKLSLKIVPTRIDEFGDGFMGIINPIMEQRDKDSFLFDRQMRLVALPLGKRTITEERYNNNEETTAANFIADLLKDRAKNFDANNIPRSGNERNQLAWLGIYFQSMNKELLKANKISNMFNDGETGLMVSKVFPDSPAAAMNLKVGDVILFLTPENSARRIKIKDYEFRESQMEAFPWNRYDEIPEEYFDQIPMPWESLENSLNQALTQIGIGQKMVIGVVSGGKQEIKTFTIEKAPPRFEDTPKYINKEIGITTCDLTPEVRQYFQMKPQDPGIMVSKVRPGSRASIAGIKPYEIIVRINGTPLKSAEELKVGDKKEIQLEVKRMGITRIVKINLDAPGPASVFAK